MRKCPNRCDRLKRIQVRYLLGVSVDLYFFDQFSTDVRIEFRILFSCGYSAMRECVKFRLIHFTLCFLFEFFVFFCSYDFICICFFVYFFISFFFSFRIWILKLKNNHSKNNHNTKILLGNEDRTKYNHTEQMYEDSIQELNNLIGELDSYQREQDQKVKQKHYAKHQHQTSITTIDTSAMSSNSFDNSSTHDGAYAGDDIDRLNDLTDCHGTTMSLKLNLSTTEHPLVLQMNCSPIKKRHTNDNNTAGTVVSGPSRIELIPDSYNVSDDYVKEHTEIVVLRRSDNPNDMNGSQEHHSNHSSLNNRCVDDVDSGSGSGGRCIERISSFRCSSFAKTDLNGSNDGDSTVRLAAQSYGSTESIASSSAANRYKLKENTNGAPVITQYDQDRVDHELDNNNAASHIIRQKPIITPRPTSLSGSFEFFFSFFFLSQGVGNFYYFTAPY